MLDGTEILLSAAASSFSAAASGVSASFGFRLMFSVRVEMKMGVRPPAPRVGNLGKLGILGPEVVVSWLSFLSSCSLCLCLSLNLARNGFGRLKLRPDMMEGPALSATEDALVGSISEAFDELTRLGLMLDLALLLDLEMVEELKPLDEVVKAGELCGNGELAGVAINVGVMSLLVMMATVVLLLPLDLKFGLGLGLNKLGLMTGVKVRLGLVKVNLP